MVALKVLLALVGCGSSVSWELLKGDCRPTGEEVWYDGVDQDCDGNDDDQDGDGISVDEDCWDDPNDGTFLADAVGDGLTLTADQVFPGAEEIWYDGVDQDCDGASDFDQDGDGFESANDEQADGSVGDDCVDGGVSDEVFEDSCSGELITVDPEDAANVNPDATDTFYDGVDQNCDGADDNDADGDGYAVCNECDDTDADTFPSDVPEIWYDCADQNCDGNDGDYDGDGYVDAEYTASCPDWATINPGKQDGDCWDDIFNSDPDFTAINGNPKLSHADVHPDAEDIPYDGVDAACDGDVYEFDADQDGFDSDSEPNRMGELGEDCHDDVAAAYPGATEECDSEDIDHDCDGNLNDPSALGCVTFYVDVDKDSYGVNTSLCLCEAEGTYSASNNDDCDDDEKAVNPGATEGVGDSVDSNCDGTESCYTDADNDGYRDSASTVLTSSDTDCDDSGEATSSDLTGDCNDADSAISPGDPEICDSSNTDEDCDGKADNDDLPSTSTIRYYKDADGDLYGASSDTGALRCDADTTYKVTNNTDCNDSNSSINTAATEIAGDEVDQNCNSTETCYKDSDNDGYRPDSTSTVSSSDTDCVDSGEAKSSEPTTDCDDTNVSRYPTNTEITGDGIDQDCDLKEICFIDVDNDNYYLSSGTVTSSDTDCSDSGEGSTSDTSGDCNDGSSAINPGASEITGDEIDQNCNGTETCYLDDDNDGYRPNSTSTKASTDTDCKDTDEATSSEPTGDCNDASSSVNPAATEVVGDGTDQNCDGTETCYKDSDNDGYRPDSSSTVSSTDADCTDSGEALSTDPTTDCNDSASTAYPGGSEVCDASNVDEDCDGLTDDNDSSVSSSTKIRYYKDADGDGYGSSSDVGALSCDGTTTYKVTANSDCDDSSSSTSPGVSTDTCWNGVDNDCDDVIDEGSSSSKCYTGGELVISEIMFYSLGAVDPNGEFFEVYNPSSTNTVYLETMQIVRTSTSSSTVTIYVSDSLAVGPTDTVVFCYSDVSLGSTCDYVYGSDQGFSEPLGNSFDSNFTMSNTNASTTLTITATSNHVSADVLLDSVNYDASGGGGWPTTSQGYSFELKSSKLNSTSNNTGSNWCRTTASAYYAPGALKDYGTPNATNTCP